MTVYIREGYSAQLGDRRRNIGKLGKRIGGKSAAHRSRHREDERHTDSTVVKTAALEAKTVVSQHLTVIRGINYKRIITQTKPVKRVKYPADVPVNYLAHSVI